MMSRQSEHPQYDESNESNESNDSESVVDNDYGSDHESTESEHQTEEPRVSLLSPYLLNFVTGIRALNPRNIQIHPTYVDPTSVAHLFAQESRVNAMMNDVLREHEHHYNTPSIPFTRNDVEIPELVENFNTLEQVETETLPHVSGHFEMETIPFLPNMFGQLETETLRNPFVQNHPIAEFTLNTPLLETHLSTRTEQIVQSINGMFETLQSRNEIVRHEHDELLTRVDELLHRDELLQRDLNDNTQNEPVQLIGRAFMQSPPIANLVLQMDANGLPTVTVTPVTIRPPLNEPPKLSRKPQHVHYIDRAEYNETTDKLKSFSVQQIKDKLKEYGLLVSGSKAVIQKRLEDALYKFAVAPVLIQRIFRGKYSRIYRKLLVAYSSFATDKYVNSTDFCTLDPIDEIPHQNRHVISYDNGIKYIFDICSLKSMFALNKFTNPYTNQPFHKTVIGGIRLRINLFSIIYPFIDIQNKKEELDGIASFVLRQPPTRTSYFGEELYAHTRGREALEVVERLKRVRIFPVNQRIENVFAEIDLLGNYTQAAWFCDIDTINKYRIFMSRMVSMFCHLDRNIRKSAYIINGNNIMYGLDVDIPHQRQIEFYKEISTVIMENLIFGVIGDEMRSLCAVFILHSLTLVSSSARRALPHYVDI